MINKTNKILEFELGLEFGTAVVFTEPWSEQFLFTSDGLLVREFSLFKIKNQVVSKLQNSVSIWNKNMPWILNSFDLRFPFKQRKHLIEFFKKALRALLSVIVWHLPDHWFLLSNTYKICVESCDTCKPELEYS